MTKHLEVVIAECPEKVVPEVRALIEIHSYDLLSADRLDMSYLSLHKNNKLTNSEVFKSFIRERKKALVQQVLTETTMPPADRLQKAKYLL